MGRAMPHDDGGRHAEPIERIALEALWIDICGLRGAELVQGEVHERGRAILDRRKTLAEIARRSDALPQRGRHWGTGDGVLGEALQHRGMHEPVLVDLARELHEIARNARAGDRRVGHVGRHGVQRW